MEETNLNVGGGQKGHDKALNTREDTTTILYAIIMVRKEIFLGHVQRRRLIKGSWEKEQNSYVSSNMTSVRICLLCSS